MRLKPRRSDVEKFQPIDVLCDESVSGRERSNVNSTSRFAPARKRQMLVADLSSI